MLVGPRASSYPTRVDPQNGKQLGMAGTTGILGTYAVAQFG